MLLLLFLIHQNLDLNFCKAQNKFNLLSCDAV